MNLSIIVQKLALFDKLTRKERVDILYNLAIANPKFKELLSIIHNENIKKFLNSNSVKVTATTSHSLFKRIRETMLNRAELLVTSEEYFTIKILVSTKYITTTEWNNLQKLLQYTPLQIATKKDKELHECQICSFPSEKFICLSCKRNIQSFLEYRRESFQIPINYINFNIRVKINDAGEVLWNYKDWAIKKYEGSKIVNCELTTLDPSFERYEPDLPFVEYQRRIT